jgi:hypothetical protein
LPTAAARVAGVSRLRYASNSVLQPFVPVSVVRSWYARNELAGTVALIGVVAGAAWGLGYSVTEAASGRGRFAAGSDGTRHLEARKPFLQKPFTPLQLSRKIREVIDEPENDSL